MNTLISKYIGYHENAWSKTTLKTVSARLNAVFTKHGERTADPAELLKALKDEGAAPYSTKQLFVYLRGFFQWAAKQDTNYKQIALMYEEFLEMHANKFKHVYEKQELGISFDSAKERVLTIIEEAPRQKALQLLKTGMRYSESNTLKDGRIVGKGAKPRRVFNLSEGESAVSCSYTELYRALKKIGLTPHMLRKLAATRLVESGEVREADLMKVFGWSSMQSAASYLQPKRDADLARLMSNNLK